MSSIIVACILLSIITIICLVLVSINNKHRRKTAIELITRFQRLEKENNLSFSEKEILENFIIGLDKIHKKVVVLRKSIDKYDVFVIDLKEVKSCVKKDIYNNIETGNPKKLRYEKHLDKIVLECNYINKVDPVQICFYESMGNHLLEKSTLEQKANDWEIIITKTLLQDTRRTTGNNLFYYGSHNNGSDRVQTGSNH